MNERFCDTETGQCSPAPLAESGPATAHGAEAQIIYVGDPMCSWCWGIAPALRELREYAISQQLSFRIVVGGLRPGGGDRWTSEFRAFLRHHWETIGQQTGQPFRFGLLERPTFNYDTEPSCRAIVAARPLVGARELDFFHAVQHRFYVDGEDPKDLDFYNPLCRDFHIDADAFALRFESAEVRRETADEFSLNRSWGVSGYPTVLLLQRGGLTTLAVGFSTFAQIRARIAAARQVGQ